MRYALALVCLLGCVSPRLEAPRPCEGANDPRYSCRAVPDRQPNTVRAMRRGA